MLLAILALTLGAAAQLVTSLRSPGSSQVSAIPSCASYIEPNATSLAVTPPPPPPSTTSTSTSAVESPASSSTVDQCSGPDAGPDITTTTTTTTPTAETTCLTVTSTLPAPTVSGDCGSVAAAVEPCAQGCFGSAAQQVGCGLADYACQCSPLARSAALPLLVPCLEVACPTAALPLVAGQSSAVCVCASAAASAGAGGGGRRSSMAITTTTCFEVGGTVTTDSGTATTAAAAPVATAGAGGIELRRWLFEMGTLLGVCLLVWLSAVLL